MEMKSRLKNRKVKTPKTGKDEFWELRLFVAGNTPASEQTIKNLNEICEKYMRGRYSIEVIDLLQCPKIAKDEQIFAIPTLVRKLPLPIRKIIGDLSSREQTMIGLDLRPVNLE